MVEVTESTPEVLRQCSLMKIDQADVVNDNGRKLPKVPPKYYQSVH